MHLRHRLKFGKALAAAGLVVLLASCEQIDNALLPGGADSGIDSGGTLLGTSDFVIPEVPPFADSGTAVGAEVEALRGDLFDLQNRLRQQNATLQRVRSDIRGDVFTYNQTVATINESLQAGSAAGNPALLANWEEARRSLDRVYAGSSDLQALENQIGSSQAQAGFIASSTEASFGFGGASDTDQENLTLLQEETDETTAVILAMLKEVSGDVARTSDFLAKERAQMTELSASINAGQSAGSGATSGQPAPAPGGQSLSPTREPLVIIRFDQPDVAYEGPLQSAVAAALERKSDAVFDVVAVTPDNAQALQNSERGRRNAERVVQSLTRFGLPPERVTLAAATDPNVQVDEVYVYVR